MRLSIVRHEVVVGWFLAVTVLLTGVGLALKARATGMVGSTEVWLVVPDGLGVQPGAPVTMRGIQVGEAAHVTFDDEGQVRIGCRVKDEFMRFVRDDSEAEVVAAPVLGTTKVVLHPGDSEEVALAGHVLRVRSSTNILDRVDAVGGKVERLVERIDALVTSVDGTLKRVNELSDKVQRGDGLVARLVNDPQMGQDAASALSNAAGTFERVNGPVLDRALTTIEHVDTVVAEAQQLLADLRAEDGRVATLLREAEGAMSDAREVLRQLEPEKTAASLRATADAVRVAAEDGGQVIRRVDPALERLQATLTAIEQAAVALQQLTRELSRQPNSVIFGREAQAGPGTRR